jgi:RND family efflux transporter MFP subunit
VVRAHWALPVIRHVTRAALSGLLIAGVSCSHGADGDEPDGGSRTLVPVETATVIRDSVVESLALTGRLEARPGGSALLAAPAAGVIGAVRVQVGDRIARGTTVIELEVPELAADARQKAAAADQADREAARQRQLLADGITSARQAEEAAATAEQAKAAAAAARDLLARTRIASPINGRIQAVLVQRGERVDAGKPLVQIVAPDTLDLIVPVPAADLRRLSPGLPVAVVQEGDTAPVRGRLAAVAPAVDSLTNAGQAVIRIANPTGHLHPGAGATARVQTAVRPQALVVPESAIVLAGDSSVVYVVGPDSIAHQRVVTRGAASSGRVEVEGRIQAGDRVVTTGAFGLQDGMRVSPSASRR